MVGRAREGGVKESLRAQLEAERVGAHFLRPARAALKHPWCWPTDGALAAGARALGASEPRASEVGEALLVSVSDGAPREALWALRWLSREEGTPFGASAHASLVLAAKTAVREVSHLHSLRAVEALPRFAGAVFKRGPDLDRVLDDRSYGLAMFLAASSALTDRPVASRVVALGALGGEGVVEAVAGLDRKLSLLAESALGVDTALVASSQHAEARRIVAALGARLELIPVERVRDALAAVFPDAAREMPGSWRDEARARERTSQLFELCTQGGDLVSWEPVLRAATWLASRFEPTTRSGAEAQLARLIARRHANGGDIAIPWDLTVRGARAYLIAAHVLQAAADAGLDETEAYIDRAKSMLLDGSDEPDELRLEGAVGRALASRRRYREALDHLESATRAWCDRGAISEVSYPLSEWLRVAAIVGDEASWGRANELARGVLAPGGGVGAAFVRFAQGRGLATLGRHAEALGVLEEARALDAPSWLAGSIARWRAVSLAALGRVEEAAAERDVIGEPSRRFAALDAAREAGGEVSTALDEIARRRPQGVRWLLEAGQDLWERAAIVAREDPY